VVEEIVCLAVQEELYLLRLCKREHLHAMSNKYVYENLKLKG